MSRSLTHTPASSPGQPAASTPPPVAVLLDHRDVPLFQAVSPHAPGHDGELTLAAGDIVTSVRQLGNGWALGRNESAADRPAGIFPVACVVAVHASPAPPPPKPAAPADNRFVECRRCGGSLPVSRTQPAAAAASRPLSGGNWGPVDIPPRQDIELVPRVDPPPQEAAGRADDGEGTPTAARVSFPPAAAAAVDDAADSPSTVPRRLAPLPPKPQLVVKPTRDKPVAVNHYTTPSKSPGTATTDPQLARVRSPRQPDEDDDDDDRRWCGVRPASHRRQGRGPPPPPPARALSTFVGRSDPTLRQTVVADADGSLQPVPDGVDSRGGCGCVDARRHARTRRCHSGVPALNGGASPDLAFGVPFRPARPILKSRTPRVSDSILAPPSRSASQRYLSSSSLRLSFWSASCRLVGSMVAGLLLAVVAFLILVYDQSFGVLKSLVASFLVAVVAALALMVSRLCRCVAALVPASLGTARGRLALCLVALSALLAGPAPNVRRNAGEAARSLSCSAELALNRTASLLRPFDRMMGQLERTVSRLEGAAADVAEGLEPLDEGLDAAEMDVENAHTQLLGTRRVCHAYSNNSNTHSSGFCAVVHYCVSSVCPSVCLSVL